jgi:hypothetical protein
MQVFGALAPRAETPGPAVSGGCWFGRRAGDAAIFALEGVIAERAAFAFQKLWREKMLGRCLRFQVAANAIEGMSHW